MPSEVHHPRLGLLRWDGYGSNGLGFEGRYRNCSVTLDPFSGTAPGEVALDVAALEEFLDACADRIDDLFLGLPAVVAFAAGELVGEYNRFWREYSAADADGEVRDVLNPEIDAAQLAGCLTLDSVVVNAGSDCDVCFDDGELFGGHAVIVSVDADGTPSRAQLFG